MSQFQALENRMYRAPIFEQPMAVTDFIVIQSGIEFFFRHVGMMGLQIPGHTYIPVVRLEKSIKRRRGQWQISISC